MRVEGNDQRLAAITATQMQNTGTQQMLASTYAKEQETQKASKDYSPQPVAGDKISINVELPKSTVDTLQKIGNISDFLNTTAANLRQTNEGLQEASKLITDMKSSLDKIIKNYPPYSIESQARINQLMNFSSLKKQIQNLEFPKPPPPFYEVVRHLWEDLFSDPEDRFQIPDLPSDASDNQVADAAAKLEEINPKIAQIQEGMSNAVKS